MDITIRLDGTTPLLQHDVRLADPDDPVVQEIKSITDKRKKTEQDRREVERLEWFGGLVLMPAAGNGAQAPAVKTAAIRKCLINAGKISKQGTAVARALAFSDLMVPLIYDGPKDPLKLWELAEHRHRASVGIGKARTMRVRPQFQRWAVAAKALLLEDVLSLDDFVRIAERAGLAEGLGDNRANGYGRFVAAITKGRG